MKKKAFSYVRMSTEAQLTGDSKRRQLEKTKSFAENKGYEFVESLEDIGISAFKGKNKEIGQLGVFRDSLNSGKIKAENTVLLVESLDRLSRENAVDAFTDLASFLKTGLTVITVSDGQEYTKKSLGANVGILYTALGVMIRANEESQIKSDRLKEAWKTKRKNINDKKLTSRTPAWIRLNLKINEFEGVDDQPAATVRLIFELCIDEGMGAVSIARYLNDNLDEYPKFTKPRKKNRVPGGRDKTGWYDSYVKKILNNPAVYGRLQLHEMSEGKRIPVGDPIDGYFPEVISEERYTLAQAKIAERRVSGAGRRGVTFANIFTNILKCHSCGGSVTFRDKGQPPKGGKYLRCRNAELHANCSSPSWQYGQFEESFFEFIAEVSLDAIFQRDEEVNQIKELHEKKLVIDQLLVKEKEEYELYRKRLSDPRMPDDALGDCYKDIEAQKNKLNKIVEEREEIRRILAELESRNASKTQDEMIGIFNELSNSASLPDAEKKALRRKVHGQIRSVVREIRLNNNQKPTQALEVVDDLSDKFLSLLVEKRVFVWPPRKVFNSEKGEDVYIEKCKTKIEGFMETNYGKRLYNESERTFIVDFKNGTSKTVHPFLRKSHMRISEKMAEFHMSVTK